MKTITPALAKQLAKDFSVAYYTQLAAFNRRVNENGFSAAMENGTGLAVAEATYTAAQNLVATVCNAQGTITLQGYTARLYRKMHAAVANGNLAEAQGYAALIDALDVELP